MSIVDENNEVVTESFDYPLPPTNEADDSDTGEQDGETDIILQSPDIETSTLFPPMKKKTNIDIVRPTTTEKDSLFILHDDDQSIKSKIGNAILNVLGPIKNLQNFEKNYNLHKTFPKEYRFLNTVDSCKRALVCNIKDLRHKALKWLGEWEKQFFVDNLREPTEKDYDSLSSIVNKKIVLAGKILKAWKVMN